jgi:hypothetical protein
MLNANPNVIVKPLDEEKEEDGKVTLLFYYFILF